MTIDTSVPAAETIALPRKLGRIAVGINGLSEGEDALALGTALARVSGADLMLVAVHPQLFVVLPPGLDWNSLRQAARNTLGDAQARMAPKARTIVESDVSVPRALQRVARRDHRDLLVLGSSRHAQPGHIRIGKRTRQLLGQFECALAIAPRGLHQAGPPALRRIGVGYDGGPESQAALDAAASLALDTGAEIQVHAVLDDRLPPIGWTTLGRTVTANWDQMISNQVETLREQVESAARRTGLAVQSTIQRGRPADCLLGLSREVDLLLVGSRRWGPVARALLGSTGEALLHDGACPVIVVPRPRG